MLFQILVVGFTTGLSVVFAEERNQGCVECESSLTLLQTQLQFRKSLDSSGKLDYVPNTRSFVNGSSNFQENLLSENASELTFSAYNLQVPDASKAYFNPALSTLPRRVARLLNMLDAVYVVVTRHHADHCWSTVVDADNYVATRSTTVLLLDESLNTIADAKIMKPAGVSFDLPACDASVELLEQDPIEILSLGCVVPYFVGHDVRLLVRNDALWMSFVDYRKGGKDVPQQWMTKLTLQLADGKLSASAEDADIASPKFMDAGKNIGLFERGSNGLQALFWAFPPTVQNINTSQQINGSVEENPFTKILLDNDDMADGGDWAAVSYSIPHIELSNNINPLLLPGNATYLGIGHDHAQFHDADGQLKFKGYTHRFVLFDAVAPYNATYLSRPFCFPAPGRPGECEQIQFAPGAVLTPDLHVLISVGILDCVSRIYRIPLSAILAFTTAYDASSAYLEERKKAANAEMLKLAKQFEQKFNVTIPRRILHRELEH